MRNPAIPAISTDLTPPGTQSTQENSSHRDSACSVETGFTVEVENSVNRYHRRKQLKCKCGTDSSQRLNSLSGSWMILAARSAPTCLASTRKRALSSLFLILGSASTSACVTPLWSIPSSCKAPLKVIYSEPCSCGLRAAVMAKLAGVGMPCCSPSSWTRPFSRSISIGLPASRS